MALAFSPFRFLRRQVFKLVYPAQLFFRPSNADFQYTHQYFYAPKAEGKNFIKQQLTFDLEGNKLPVLDISKPCFDAVIMKQKAANYPNAKYVIHCDGNATCYELMEDILENFAAEGFNVIAFNPMGVGMSPGVCNGPEDYEAALASIITNLKNQGVPLENIVLSGRSLGAAIATKVAAKYQAQNQRLKVVNDRSFATLDNTAGAFIQSQIPTKFLRATVGRLVYSIVKNAIKYFNLNIDARTAFLNINAKNPGDAECLWVDNDQIVSKECSLAHNLPTSMQKYAHGFKSKASDSHNAASNELLASTGTANDFICNFMSGSKKQPATIDTSVQDLINILEKAITAAAGLTDSTDAQLIAACALFDDYPAQIKLITQRISKFDAAQDDATAQLLILAEDVLHAVEIKKLAILATIRSNEAARVAKDASDVVRRSATSANNLDLEIIKFKAEQYQSLAALKRAEALRLENESNSAFEQTVKTIKSFK